MARRHRRDHQLHPTPATLLDDGSGFLVAKRRLRKSQSSATREESLSPGSRVVTDYFEKAGLQTYLDQLGFQVAGYGCMTCIGNSGPLPIISAGKSMRTNLVVAGVLSGIRNFRRAYQRARQSN